MKTIFTLALLLLVGYGINAKVVLYPGPDKEPKSNDFKMFVNDQPVFVYQARVSKYPINQEWPGYQRPMNQTEIASFAYFDFSGKIEVKIISDKPVKTLNIRPTPFGIKSSLNGNTITFSLSKPMQFVVEVNGYHNALHVFANPIETFKIKRDDPKVHYFGPGIHDAGRIKLKSDETLFIDGGAVVYGSVEGLNVSNIKIMGRGILDASKIGRTEARNMIFLREVRDAKISGIILRDPQEWAVRPQQCDNVDIDGVKLIGFWRYNADGIDMVNSRKVTISNCFIRAYDDNIVVKGLPAGYKDPLHRNVEDLKINNCVLWNDWGRALEIGAETVADTIKNISFTNCYIPRFTFIALDIQNGDKAWVKNVRFENIFVEEPILDSARMGNKPEDITKMAKSIELKINGHYALKNDSFPGNTSDIYFKNIHYNSQNPTFSNFLGFDKTHIINNIHIKDYFINEKKVTDQSTFKKNEFVKNIFVE